MTIKWDGEESAQEPATQERFDHSKRGLTISQKNLDLLQNTSKFINQNIARPFVDVAAMPVQGLAKAMGKPDPYAGAAMADIPVNPLENTKGKTGSAIEAGSYGFPLGRVAQGISKIAAPVGKFASRVLGGVGAGAAGGYSFDVGSKMSHNEENPMTPGAGTAIGAAVPGLGEATGALARAATPSAEALINTLIKPLSKQFSYGKDPGRTVAELGITANSFEELAHNIANARHQIGAQISDISQTMPGETKVLQAEDALAPFNQAIMKAVNTNNQPLLSRLSRAKDAITNIFALQDGQIAPVGSRVLTNLTYDQGLQLKQMIGDMTEWTGKKTEDETVNGALTRVYGLMKGKLDTLAGQYSPEIAKTLRKLNQQYADLTSAEIATKYRDVINKRLNIINLPGAVGAVGGVIAAIATGNPAFILGSIASYGVDRVLSSTPVRTRLAAWLAKAAPEEKNVLFGKFPALQEIETPGDTLIDKSKEILKESGGERGFVRVPKALGGAPEDSPTLKSLERMNQEVKTPTVSAQYIRDLAQRGDTRQAEREILTSTLEEMGGDTINVADFSNKVKTELLPLRAVTGGAGKYENITLPNELRGPIAAYDEHIYQSPIKTSAGGVHFNGMSIDDKPLDDYFAHSRIEDLPPDGMRALQDVNYRSADERAFLENKPGSTRRVIELQSDLFQKGRLESESGAKTIRGARSIDDTDLELAQIDSSGNTKVRKAGETQALRDARDAELAKLEPYRNTWHERVIREEVKQAAKDGKTKLQFPTGETAMKIEGLGDVAENTWAVPIGELQGANRFGRLQPDMLEKGIEIRRGGDAGYGREPESWIITDVLGDGKFKAVNDVVVQNNEPAYRYLQKIGKDDDGRFPTLTELKGALSDKEFKGLMDVLNKENVTEAFDISGKVDTSNPIYKFYEKEVGKYLTNKFGAKRITDPQGVQWWEIPVDPKKARAPVEAFGAAAVLTGDDNN